MRISDWSSDVCSSDLDRMTEGRVVDLQRDIVAGLLTRALPPRTDFRPVIVGAEMDAEVRGVLGVGIVRRYEHHFGIDGKGANAPRIAALGAAELTDQRHGFLLGCAVEKVMGASSPRRRAPDEAAIAVLVGVERGGDRKSTRLNSSHSCASRMPSSA